MMNLITPASCIIKIQGFLKRMDRLEADDYTLPRLKTQDLNMLVHDLRAIKTWASIGIFNKNKERAKGIINQADLRLRKAREIREQFEIEKYERNEK